VSRVKWERAGGLEAISDRAGVSGHTTVRLYQKRATLPSFRPACGFLCGRRHGHMQRRLVSAGWLGESLCDSAHCPGYVCVVISKTGHNFKRRRYHNWCGI
ncbi:unnamed protein product, partial [Ectocarpus sp. 13 AM-2016]